MFALDGCGVWGITRHGGIGIEGFCGYRDFHDAPELQLVCGLSETSQGEGLATEACREVIRYGFEALGMRQVVAEADTPNDASIRLMGRLGMEFEARFTIMGRDTVRYLLAREEVPSPARPN